MNLNVTRGVDGVFMKPRRRDAVFVITRKSTRRVRLSRRYLSTQGDPQHGFAEGESGFEGIFHDKTQDGMYVVREAVDISGVFPAHSFHAIDATAAARPSGSLRHRRDVH